MKCHCEHTTEVSSSSSFISASRTPRFDVTWSTGEPDATACRAVASRLRFRFNAASDPWINISSWLRLSRFSFSVFLSHSELQRGLFSIGSSAARPPPPPLCSRSSHLPSLCIFDREFEPRHLPPLVESIAIYSSLPGHWRLFAFALSFQRSINDLASLSLSFPLSTRSRVALILMHRDIARCNSTKAPRILSSSTPSRREFNPSFEIFHGSFTITEFQLVSNE